MRRFASFFCTLASIALLAGLFLTSVQLVVMDRSFFKLEYHKMDTARRLGVAQSALDEVTDDLLRYLEGEDIELMDIKARVKGEKRRVFARDDVAHMVDVKDLYGGALMVRNIVLLFALLVLLLTLLGLRRDKAGLFARAYIRGMVIVGAILLVLGVWIQLDFDMFWNAFHHLFFRNMLWQMDPSTSFMINMFPGQFWYDICMRVLLYFGIGAGALLAASIVVVILHRRRRNTLMVLEDAEEEVQDDSLQGSTVERWKQGERQKRNDPSAPWQNT